MKRLVCIELLEEHTKASFYKIRFADEELSEFDKFWDFYDPKPKFNKDMDRLAYWMQKIGNDVGIDDDYLRPEGRLFLKALPIDFSKLRVYCFRIENIILLFAGGGEKTTRTYQEDPKLNSQVQYARLAGNKILRYIKLGKISIVDRKLVGKLSFEIEL